MPNPEIGEKRILWVIDLETPEWPPTPEEMIFAHLPVIGHCWRWRKAVAIKAREDGQPLSERVFPSESAALEGCMEVLYQRRSRDLEHIEHIVDRLNALEKARVTQQEAVS